MHEAKNQAKIPGVNARYKLKGRDQMKAVNMRYFLWIRDEMMAKQAGRTNMTKVVAARPSEADGV